MYQNKKMPDFGDMQAPDKIQKPGNAQQSGIEAKNGFETAQGGAGLTSIFGNADIQELLTKFGADVRGADEFLQALLKKANKKDWKSVPDNDPAVASMITYAATVDGSFKGNFKAVNGWREKLDVFVVKHFSSGSDTGHRDPPTFIKLLFIMAGEPIPSDLDSKDTAELAVMILERLGLDVPEWLLPETDRSFLQSGFEEADLYTGEATTQDKGVLHVVYTPGGLPEVDYQSDAAEVSGAVAVHTVHNPDNALIRALADLDIFHTIVISGHGTEEGIMACDSGGMARVMEPDEMASTFAGSSITNVILAACHGATVGESTNLDIDLGPFGGSFSVEIPDQSVADTLALYGFNVAAFDGLVSEAEVKEFLSNVAEVGGFGQNGADFMQTMQSVDKEDDRLHVDAAGQGALPDSVQKEIDALRAKVDALMATGELDEGIDDAMEDFERIGRPNKDGPMFDEGMYDANGNFIPY